MTGYLRAFGFVLFCVGFSIVFITGTFARLLAAAVVWCAGQPAWFWAAVLLAVVMWMAFKDSRK